MKLCKLDVRANHFANRKLSHGSIICFNPHALEKVELGSEFSLGSQIARDRGPLKEFKSVTILESKELKSSHHRLYKQHPLERPGMKP